jgi:ribonuclease P protein component
LKQFTLSRQERLKSRKQIDQLFNSGKYFNVSPLRVIYEVETGDGAPPLQFGVAVSSRNFKKAVERNRVKRLVREAWRLQKLPLQDQLKEKGLVLRLFLVYTGRELPDQQLITERTGLVILRLANIIDGKNTPNT